MSIRLIPVLLAVGLLLMPSCMIQKVYVVRHAEKGEGEDPGLTQAGRERAEALAELLAAQEVKAVFSTSFLRNLHTALPTATAFGLPVQSYHHDTLRSFVHLQLNHLKGNALVVGHSNTVLPIVRALGGKPSMEEIGHLDYDNLFIVNRKRFLFWWVGRVEETTFGAATP